MTFPAGSCLCGAVKYELRGSPLYAAYCHCSECRKFSGSAFAALAGFRVQDLTIHTMDIGGVGAFEKSARSRMRFCLRCGSSLFVEKPDLEVVHVRLGTLDEADTIRPQAHIYVASKAAWFDLPADGLPRFSEAPAY